MNVRIFVESSWHGKAKMDGVAMWLVEYMKGEIPITRQGFIHMEAGDEYQGNLRALINAFTILKVPCDAAIYTQNMNIYNTMANNWQIQWKKNGWINSKGKEPTNKELWVMLTEKMEHHHYTISKEHHDYKKVMDAAVEKELTEWSKTK